MASSKPKYPLGSPQEHTEMCKTHDLPIDVICDDFNEFICGKCIKTDHRDHDWNTVLAAATQRRRGLIKFLRKIKEEELPGINEKLEKVSKQITENKELCDSEIKRLQKHYNEIMARMTNIKEHKEQQFRDNLKKNNEKLDVAQSELNKKKKEIADIVKFLEEYNSTMSDYGFIDNYRELTQLLSGLDVDMKNSTPSVRYSTVMPNLSVSGLLKSDHFELELHSRRLVRHITVTCDVIHEYEYQEDGQTRLFTLPRSVTQNSNSDICVVNRTNSTVGELVIMCTSGRVKYVYRGQNLTEDFWPGNAVWDSLCNILVPDLNDKQIHLLSPVGEFLKYLLTENEVNCPTRLSLYKSTLWVGNMEGLVKVFQYTM
ncbi:uncharacterized protein LOC133187009 [Saccostrea echinata]|uniref:uncharacterized protein LOC133187009 n=1 Tax=Saccostrea echinata TaxID=191078 RepID=UPI002A83C3F0|nr:uncharacterized protein LOC133187009 [Saccostrea echinata]